MSGAESRKAQAQASTDATEGSLFESAIAATKQTERARVHELLRAFTEEVLKGTVTWDQNVTRTIQAGIAALDQAISRQLAAILHHPEFQRLEGTWRGLNYLVVNSETSAQLKLKVLNCGKQELFQNLDEDAESDQSQQLKKMLENEFATPGGELYGALIGDYEFTNHPEDVDLLAKMSRVAAAAFCPFISAAAPSLFGFEAWTELTEPRDLKQIFDTVEHIPWRSFRDSEDSRFVTLTMPRVLARLPYGSNTRPVEEFAFEEVEVGTGKRDIRVPLDPYCWMNAAYVLGTKLTDAFAKYGWCTAIWGAEGEAKVEGLPAHVFQSDDGRMDLTCPTEVGITDGRKAELSRLGFLPLCHNKNTDAAFFFGAQTAHQPKKYDWPGATANDAICARLPCLMATARFVHYLKVMPDWKIWFLLEAKDCAAWLNRWIHNYVSADSNPSEDIKVYPQCIGPSVTFDGTGKVTAGGKLLTTVPTSVWVHIEIEASLGKTAPPKFTLTIVPPNGQRQLFADLPWAGTDFHELQWLGFVSTAASDCVFYLDNLQIKRLDRKHD